jgi:hypothetical protein
MPHRVYLIFFAELGIKIKIQTFFLLSAKKKEKLKKIFLADNNIHISK